MPDYDALNEILGKTIKGVIVKQNKNNGFSSMSVHFVFDDDTSYEIYADYRMSFAGGVNSWDMEKARKYGVPPTWKMFSIYP